jgi:hypothetical protein
VRARHSPPPSPDSSTPVRALSTPNPHTCPIGTAHGVIVGPASTSASSTLTDKASLITDNPPTMLTNDPMTNPFKAEQRERQPPAWRCRSNRERIHRSQGITRIRVCVVLADRVRIRVPRVQPCASRKFRTAGACCVFRREATERLRFFLRASPLGASATADERPRAPCLPDELPGRDKVLPRFLGALLKLLHDLGRAQKIRPVRIPGGRPVPGGDVLVAVPPAAPSPRRVPVRHR